MTTEKLEQAKQLKNRIDSIQMKLDNAELQTCTGIIFSYNNGQTQKSVCDDEALIRIVRLIIVSELTDKLNGLKKQFENL